MPQTQPDPDTEIITLDLPVPVYLEALRTAQELGFPSLEAYAAHLVDQLMEDNGQQSGTSGSPSLGQDQPT